MRDREKKGDEVTTPYYEDDHATIYHGDALDVLRQVESESVDAVVTDPPFQLLTRTFEAANNALEVSLIWPVAQELRRIIGRGGLSAVFYDSRALPLALRSFGYAGWTYLRHLTFYRRWGAAHQFQGWMSTSDFVLVFSRGDAPPCFYGPWRHDVYVRDRKEAEPTGHPCQKPLEAVSHLVGNITAERGRVIDPFMGSGTTLVAAAAIGRHAVGIESDERYCEIAARRLRKEIFNRGE